jgi:hypothetical protein
MSSFKQVLKIDFGREEVVCWQNTSLGMTVLELVWSRLLDSQIFPTSCFFYKDDLPNHLP